MGLLVEQRAADPHVRLARGAWLAFALIAGVQTALIFSHSPWFDEEHALLIARAPWSDLKHNLSYEGHPALWYLWLGSVDRILGGSPLSLPAAQLPVSLGLLALIWFRSPFPIGVKLLLSLSYWIGFEYGVISRSYGLGALLLIAAVAWRQSLAGWVCLALAANTSAHGLLAAGALGGVFLMEGRNWRGALVLGCGVMAALATVYPIAADLAPTAGAPRGSQLFRVVHGLQTLSAALVPAVPSWPYRWLNSLPLFGGALIGLVVLVLGAWSLRRSIPLLAGYLVLFAALLVLSARAYELSPRHVGMLFVFLVGGWWMGAETGRLSRTSWLWLAATVICAAPFYATSNAMPFSHHREIADWIRAYHLDVETWGAWPGREGTTISAQLGRPTVNLEKGCLNTFVRWDYPHEKVSDPAAHVRAAGVRYVISEIAIPGGQELARFGRGGGWEIPTILYRFDNTPKALPTCR